MTAKYCACIALFGALVGQAVQAAPTVSITPGGLNAGNRQWFVDITPDGSLFANNPPNGVGGSLTVELAFSIGPGNLVSVSHDAVNWPFDNPGNNPFTNSVGFGTEINGNNAFTAYGSTFFTTATPKSFLTLTTAGSGPTTLRYGTAASGSVNKGALIAQAGQSFAGYTGVVSVVPEPTAFNLAAFALGATVLVIGRCRIGTWKFVSVPNENAPAARIKVFNGSSR